MVVKKLVAEFVDGRLVLPTEALALLPRDALLRVIADTDAGTICIHAVPPPGAEIENREVMDAYWTASQAMGSQDHGEPVTEATLRGLKETRWKLQRAAEERAARRDNGDHDA